MKMKKIFLVIVIFVAHFSVQGQGFEWGRVNVSVDMSSQSSFFNGGAYLFKNHPERAAHFTLGYRLGRYWELAGYLGYSASAPEFLSTLPSPDPGYTVAFSNGARGIYGAILQYHLAPYGTTLPLSLAIRVGFDLSGIEADGAWLGVVTSYRLTHHVTLNLDTDCGSFRCARRVRWVFGEHSLVGRAALRLQVSF